VGFAPKLPPLAVSVVVGVAEQIDVPLLLLILVMSVAGVRVATVIDWQGVLPLQAPSTRAL
jgi:hypothetical protein